ncbi:hypothetical protein L4174_007040 [Photobacterium sp. CCB-ST2H9]|uniref:hypothetical protein n=1 Tax=Photobacterium sp. CCB-ST2H9 TaxID=2912855 RepID=UPI002006AB71|nr:hypothetical protein [Photobacterium sp. CCB-ST2H9]UTM58582.1 hypothetical protein L4174_007040 [Photobacterium sp. CCB-ST2H9]
MNIQKSIYYRKPNITGSNWVLVSIKFGQTLAKGVAVIKIITADNVDSKLNFDLNQYIEEVIFGVKIANEQYGGDLEVQEIEVIPSDSPSKGQVLTTAYDIAKYVLMNENQ